MFVRKAIPKRTQFGPIEGVLKEDSNGSVSPHGLIYTIKQGDQTLHLDTSDEGKYPSPKFPSLLVILICISVSLQKFVIAI